MTTENINIILTNAVCCISEQAVKVSKLLSIGDKCAESEVNKLKLLNDYVETLRCYNNDPINSKFTVRMLYSDYQSFFEAMSNPLRIYQVQVNSTIYTMQGDASKTKFEILEEIINTIPNVYSFYNMLEPATKTVRYIKIYIEASCEVYYVNFNTTVSEDDFLFTLTTPGNCEITNCLSEEEIQTIINKIMTTCDICDCQLIE